MQLNKLLLIPASKKSEQNKVWRPKQTKQIFGKFLNLAKQPKQTQTKICWKSAQKVPITLLQSPSEERHPKHKLIELTTHLPRRPRRNGRVVVTMTKCGATTSRYEWPDFFSSSRLRRVAIVRVQSRTFPMGEILWSNVTKKNRKAENWC